MSENVVGKDEWDIEFFFVEHTKTSFRMLTEDLAIDGDVVFRSPVGEQDGMRERRVVTIDGREVLHRGIIHDLVGPAFLFRDENRLVGPHPD